jgi:regulator of nucleoside diphosphate kinase
MRKSKHNGQPLEPALPPIVMMTDEAGRLRALANSSMALFPRVAYFLARETERAKVVASDCDLRGIVRMGSQVRYCDDKTGDVRDVVLVYPHEADISLKRVSVLTPVGAALIGLSVGQAIEFQTPGHRKHSLTILGVSS